MRKTALFSVFAIVALSLIMPNLGEAQTAARPQQGQGQAQSAPKTQTQQAQQPLKAPAKKRAKKARKKVQKKTQKTPRRETETASRRLEQFMLRKAGQ